jgi:hypothetical protein
LAQLAAEETDTGQGRGPPRSGPAQDREHDPGDRGRPVSAVDEDAHALEQRLAAAPELPKVRLHPNLAGMYRDKVAALEHTLADPAIKAEAMEIGRGLIERIVLTPNEQGTAAVRRGQRQIQTPRKGVPGRGLSLVARARFGLGALFTASGLESSAYGT